MTAQERAERFDLKYRVHYGVALAYGRRRGARTSSTPQTFSHLQTGSRGRDLLRGRLASISLDAATFEQRALAFERLMKDQQRLASVSASVRDCLASGRRRYVLAPSPPAAGNGQPLGGQSWLHELLAVRRER